MIWFFIRRFLRYSLLSISSNSSSLSVSAIFILIPVLRMFLLLKATAVSKVSICKPWYPIYHRNTTGNFFLRFFSLVWSQKARPKFLQSNFLYGEAGINPFDQHPLLNYTLQWSLPLFVVSFPYSVFFSLSYFSTFSFVPGTVTVHQSVSLMFFVTFSFVHPYDWVLLKYLSFVLFSFSSVFL